jgi:hypothetical protein
VQVHGVVRGGASRTKNIGCHIWLERRLAPGPKISLPPDPEWEVRWPPSRGDALLGPHRH